MRIEEYLLNATNFWKERLHGSARAPEAVYGMGWWSI